LSLKTQGKSIVEDVSVSDGWHCLTDHPFEAGNFQLERTYKTCSSSQYILVEVGTAAAAAAKAATAVIMAAYSFLQVLNKSGRRPAMP